MKTRPVVLLQLLLWGICAFHIMVGIGLNVSTDFLSVMAGYYGADTKTWSPDFVYIVKPLGAFMIAMGVLAAQAATRQFEHRLTVYAFVLLFVMRAIQRFVFREDLTELFAISPVRNSGNMIFFLALAIALFVLYHYAGRSRAK